MISSCGHFGDLCLSEGDYNGADPQLSWFKVWRPLACSGQSFWPQVQRSELHSRATCSFWSSGSGTGSTRPREYNRAAT
jgi:hypothetical protein